MGSHEAKISEPMTEVTVLVAVYNTGRYLGECLDSLLAQTLEAIQVVCVDDGSTDNSIDILNDYTMRDRRIEVVALPENRGIAHARNVGLGRAKGRYIAYLDSDDWLAPDALAKAVDVFRQNEAADCVLLRFVRHYEQGCGGEDSVFPMPQFDVLTGREAFDLSLNWNIHGCYVARKALYDRFNYDETCHSYSDDNITTRLHYLISREVRQCDGTYYYRNYGQSVTQSVNVHRFDYPLANLSLKQKLIELGVDSTTIRKYENIRWLILVDTYMFYHCHGGQLTAAERRHGLEVIKKVWRTIERPLLNPTTTRKFGYCPMNSWWQFRVEEWLYFTIRGLLGKNV